MTAWDFMTPEVKACGADANVATVAKIMWDCECGIVPVVNEESRLVGTITERDICIAAATRSTPLANILNRDVMAGDVYTCLSTTMFERY